MKTFVATVLVLLFCLPIVSNAAEENRTIMKGHSAQTIITSGIIQYVECDGPGGFRKCQYKVVFDKRLWDCIFVNHLKSQDIDITCFTMRHADLD